MIYFKNYCNKVDVKMAAVKAGEKLTYKRILHVVQLWLNTFMPYFSPTYFA